MSVYHSPRCRIPWTNVVSDGVDRDVVVRDKPLTLYFGLDFDNNIRSEAGWFYLVFTLLRGGQFHNHVWSGWIPTQFPSGGGNIWVSNTWPQALDLTGSGPAGIGTFQFRPQVRFNIITPGPTWWVPTGDDEFAVAEEDHYVLVE